MTTTLDEIRLLIADSETANVEFKGTTGQLERGMESICAFLNGEGGGTVLFGIIDSGKIVGQEVADATKRNIAEHIRELTPAAAVGVQYVDVENGKQVVVLHVEDSRMERPFVYKGRPYMRVESTTAVMPQDVYNDLLFQRDTVKTRWESLVNTDLKLSDLDENEILKTVRMGIENGRLPENTGTDILEILNRLELAENERLKHAAAILFAKREMSDYFQCAVRLARFRGTNKLEFIDNQQVRGNIFTLIDASMAFIFKHLSLSGVVGGLEREERLTVPYKAIREAVVNAFCHRQYRTPGASVGIAIYDDRVEIENPGSFPYGWKIEELRARKRSSAQNPLIANVLYKRKMVETWGRGIDLIVDECTSQGLPEPIFESTAGFVTITFHYPPQKAGHQNDYQNTNENIDNENNAGLNNGAEIKDSNHQNGHQTGHQTGHQIEYITRQIKDLVESLSEQSLSMQQLMQTLQKKGRDNFIVNYINPALSNGLIARLFPDNARQKGQKYYLTEKGKQLLKEIKSKKI